MDSVTKICERIRMLREGKGLTQQALADALHVKRETINMWENGFRDLKTAAIIALADFFNVSADFILGRVDCQTMEMDARAICEKTGLSEDTVNKLLQWSKTDPDTGATFPTLINVSNTTEAVKLVDSIVNSSDYGDLVNQFALFRRACLAMSYNDIALKAFAQNWLDVQNVIEKGEYEKAPASIKYQIDFMNKANVSLTMMTPGMIMMMEEWKANQTISRIASAILGEYKSQIIREGKEDAEA